MRTYDELKRMSFNDMKIEDTATLEQKALAEVVKIAMPGMKMPPATLARTIETMLLKRGVALVPVNK